MSGEGPGAKGLSGYLGMTAAVGVAGLVLAYLLPGENAGRLAAMVGVAAAVVSGAVALFLKRRAVKVSVTAALKVMGVVFGVRLLMVAVGLLWVIRSGVPPIPFVIGFFGVYFVQQWIEISYVLAEQQRGGSDR